MLEFVDVCAVCSFAQLMVTGAVALAAPARPVKGTARITRGEAALALDWPLAPVRGRL